MEEGVSGHDAVSEAAGWMIGTCMKEFGWTPEDVGRHFADLARLIQAKATEIRDPGP